MNSKTDNIESDDLTAAYMSGYHDAKKELRRQEQEPIAWEFENKVYFRDSRKLNDDIRKKGIPLYNDPLLRKPLTDEQIAQILKRPDIAEKGEHGWRILPHAFARAIQEELGIREDA